MKVLVKALTRFVFSTILISTITMTPIEAAPGTGVSSHPVLMFAGTYTGKTSKGIYAYRFDPDTGKLSELGLAAETPSPSFLAVHPNGKFLYAVNELESYKGEKAGSVSAFAMDTGTGKLKFLNAVSSKGAAPCHVAVDKSGKTLTVANYTGGSIAAFPIHADGTVSEASFFDQHKGDLGPVKDRQEAPHAHATVFSPDERFLLTADLGLDAIVVYKVDAAAATLSPNTPPFAKTEPGAGPRHIAFHPSGKFVFVVNEVNNTVAAYGYDAKAGTLSPIQSITTLPADFHGENTTAEIRVHPSGNFLYASNRGHDSIAVYHVDSKTGKLTLAEIAAMTGKEPRGFNIDPTGGWLVAGNQNSDSISVFRINPKTGKLVATGQTIKVGQPVDVLFVKTKAN